MMLSTRIRRALIIPLAIPLVIVAALLCTARAQAQEGLAGAAALTQTVTVDASTAITESSTPTATVEQTSAVELLAAETAPPLEYEPAFVEEECPFIVPWNQEIICGSLMVPENRSNLDGATISLFVAILKSLGRPETDPVLVLPGGPGGDASQSRQQFYTLPFRQNRDIILLDPRGSGASLPSLNCGETEQIGESFATYADAYLACYERLLEEGRDLAGYSTAETVGDIADLAKVLGIGKLNLYGTSYGSRVAVHLADKHPALVRSMVLEGVMPVNAHSMLEEPLNIYGVIQRVAQDCASQPACNGNFPALEARLLEVIDRYNRTPVPDEVGYGTGDQILEFLLAQLYMGGARVPAFITALYYEDFVAACDALPHPAGCLFADLAVEPSTLITVEAELESAAIGPATAPLTATAAITTPATPPWRDLFVAPEDPTGPDVESISWLMQELGYRRPGELFDYLDTLSREEVEDLVAGIPGAAADLFSEGAFASVMCAEEAPFYSLDDVRLVAARIPAQFGPLPIERATEVANICAFWSVPAISPAQKIVPAVQTPALLVNGTHDPITPPIWARRAAASMDAATLRLFPGYGHAVLSLRDRCMLELMTDFYANPTDQPATDCADDLKIEWYVP